MGEMGHVTGPVWERGDEKKKKSRLVAGNWTKKIREYRNGIRIPRI
jgi:hypothetical protein